jgi:hypothetical protein
MNIACVQIMTRLNVTIFSRLWKSIYFELTYYLDILKDNVMFM